MDQSQQAGKQMAAGPAAPRSFFSRALTSHDRSINDSSEDLKGPLGLTTLFEPTGVAIADVVFVHGLGGGSRSTWTKSGDPSLFWPLWLPQNPGFQNVRIHTFGYKYSDFKTNLLTMHDFARSLLSSIQDCPMIPRDSTVPLIFIAHSTGGLVTKKAFVLARQLPEYDTVARRVRSMFFLATPHRGSDLAATLAKILKVQYGSRPFVQDFRGDSIVTHSINDEFPHHCQNLQLFSFYETIPSHFAFGMELIVAKESAILGYDNERSCYLDADHQDMCKYVSQSDHNYLTVRNALAKTVADMRDLNPPTKGVLDSDQQRLLKSFSGISDAPEDDFRRLDSKRAMGSCHWFTEKKSFQMWIESSVSQMWWISAKPAAGKSVLSGYMVKHLKELNLDCAFYFFAHSDKEKSSINHFLLSMALQMALMHPEILQRVLEICEIDDRLCQNQTDYRTIWRKLFLECILKVKLERRQYWVIDAVDESKADPATELTSLLLQIIETDHINILVTSRNKFEPPRSMTSSLGKVISEEISAEDTQFDISLYLQAHMEDLPLIEENGRRDMARTILAKSAGCFLWVSLVLNELRLVHTATEIHKVLEGVPSGMTELYSRILDTMSRAPYGKELARAILTWTVCSARPLTTDELYHALRIDIKDEIRSVDKCIASCGHLVFVDGKSRVQMVHQTAREFLLHPNTDSEFAIDFRSAHKQLAMACLEYLNGTEMKRARYRKRSASTVTRDRCSFVMYACNCLHEHISRASSTDDDLLMALAAFLSSSNVLSWIEYLAQNSDLNRVIQTGKALKDFIQRRQKHMPPFGREVDIIDSWGTDLIRLVGKFGQTLRSSPSSIFHSIPSLCPIESAPYKQFGSQPYGISVTGQSNTTWDDCLSTIFHSQQQLSALTCSNNYFAVGASCGTITIYDNTACEEIQILDHREHVKVLRFSQDGQQLASAGPAFVKVWDVLTWKELYTFDIPTQCMSLVFTDNDRILLGALGNNELKHWDVSAGIPGHSTSWAKDLAAGGLRRPMAAEFCTNDRLLAVAYRGQDLLLWDLENECRYATFARKAPHGPSINALAFSHAPDTDLLAVSYGDGELVLLGTLDVSIKTTIMGNAHILVSSPDGRTLATAGNAGDIQLFDFETLRLLYRISSDTGAIKSLAFSGDGRRLLDIRESHCRIWDPVVLARQDVYEETSDMVSISSMPPEAQLGDPKDVTLITALACQEGGETFFCGREDGSVWQYEIKSVTPANELFDNGENIPVTALCCEKTFLSSTDTSSRVMVHKIDCPPFDNPLCFDYRYQDTVHQLLSNKDHSKLLVSTSNADYFYSINLGGSEILKTLPWTGEKLRKWANHPSNQNHLIMITDNIARIYDWETLAELTDSEGILLRDVNLGLGIRRILPCFYNTMFAITFSESSTRGDKLIFLLFPVADFLPFSQETVPACHLTDEAEHLIGAYRSRLIFLNKNGWVCSTEANLLSENVNRHFVLPADWLSNDSNLMIEVTERGDIIFVKRSEVAVIRRGLDNIEPTPHKRSNDNKAPLFIPAANDEKIAPAESENPLGRRLKQFFADLQEQAARNQDKPVSRLDHSRVGYVDGNVRSQIPGSAHPELSNLMTEGSNEKFDGLNIGEKPLQDLSHSDSSDVEVEEMTTEPEFDTIASNASGTELLNVQSPIFAKIRGLLLTGETFHQYYAIVRWYIYIDMKSKFENLFQKLSRPRREKLLEGISVEALRRVADEVHSITLTKAQVKIIRDQPISNWLNKVKLKLEDLSRESWDWWPLEPPKRNFKPGLVCMEWQCSCGQLRSEVVPEYFAAEIERRLEQRELSSTTQTSPGSSAATPQSSSQNASSMRGAPSMSSRSDSSSISGDSEAQSTSGSSFSSSPSVTGAGRSKKTAQATARQTITYVLLGTTVGEEVDLAQIEIQGHTDEQFFRELRTEYFKLRGSFRQFFSIWRYSHCDFVKFEKIGDGEIVHRGSSVPEASDDNYDYRPKPVMHQPPVSSHEFYRRFYACYGRCIGSKTPLLRSFHRCRRPCRHSQEAVERIPKKKWRVEEKGFARDFFWGIFAVEKLSFFMVALYHIIILLPPLAFWFLWLFFWGHSGDLQNASVPFLSALGLLSLFWFPILAS